MTGHHTGDRLTPDTIPTPIPARPTGRHLGMDPSMCLSCRACEELCPDDALRFVPIEDAPGVPAIARTFAAAAVMVDDAACSGCALCIRRCPTGALFFVDPSR